MQNKKNIAAARIAEKCVELSSLAALHGLDTLAMVLRMGVLEAQALTTRGLETHPHQTHQPHSHQTHSHQTDVQQTHAHEARAADNTPRVDAGLSRHAPRIVGCWNWDIASNKVYGTRQFAEFYNIDPRLAEAGAPIELFIEAIHPLDQDRVSDAIETAVRTGDDYEIEYRVIGKDQAIRWVRARGRCWRDEEGRPLHFPGSLLDVTHEKRIRAA